MTKLCAICGAKCDADATYCPICGEASWAPGTAKAKPAPKPVAKAEPRPWTYQHPLAKALADAREADELPPTKPAPERKARRSRRTTNKD